MSLELRAMSLGLFSFLDIYNIIKIPHGSQLAAQSPTPLILYS